MKILLIHPPAINMITTNVPCFADKETGFYPPLGLLYVASYLKKHTDNEVQILDAQVEQLNYEQIEERIRYFEPEVVGIQMMTFTLIDALLCAQLVKKIDPEIKVVAGGPHPNIYIQETIAKPEIDIIVLGEGEEVFCQLINALTDRKSLHGIAGIVFKENGKVFASDSKGFIKNLDELPFPDRTLIPYKKYYSLLARHQTFTTMVSSRGCPYRCLFCDRAYYGKLYRMRSPENVVQEMEECLRLGIEEIDFQDDIFTLKKERVLNICDLIIKKGLQIKWNVRSRIDTIDEELLAKMKQAGCQRIYYGIEAGTKKILDVLRKHINLDKAVEIVGITRAKGISSLAYFIIGSPEETREDILATIVYMRRLNPDFVHIAIMTPFPATDLYSLGLEKGLYQEDYWQKFSLNPSRDFVPRIWDELISRDELEKLLKIAYHSFYMRPGYIFQELLKIKTLKEFNRKVKAGIRTLLYTKGN